MNSRSQLANVALNGRQERILRFIVDQFIESGRPVGSRPISKMEEEHLSPASIRNTMADLEDLGLLSQPHTSAGRTPTDFGYRYYVENLMPESAIPLADLHDIKTFFDSYGGVVGTIFDNVSKMLSRYSHYIGIVTEPKESTLVLRQLSFYRQAPGKVLAVIVCQNGMVLNKLIDTHDDYPQELLQKASLWVTEHFQNLNLSEIKLRIVDMLREEQSQYDLLMKQSLLMSQKTMEDSFGSENVHVDGAAKFVNGMEVADKKKIAAILDAIEQKSTLLNLINSYMNSDETQVVIGSEADLQGINGCSLVAGAYTLPDGSQGNIAVLGPTRMHYPKTIYLVDYMSKQISQIGKR